VGAVGGGNAAARQRQHLDLEAPSGVGGGDASMDPFSPQAQNQLQEFDLLRAEIEATESNNNNGEKNGKYVPFVVTIM